jgi:alpha-glucoside transport system permease protein
MSKIPEEAASRAGESRAGDTATGAQTGTGTDPADVPGDASAGAGAAVTAGPAAAVGAPSPPARLGPAPGMAAGFLLPALILLAALVAYPIIYTIWRSLFDAPGDGFVGLGNYADMFTDSETFTALKNNAIWVIVVPAVVTSLGLMFAVLTEQVRWATAFKALVFMPMAISMLATGVMFTLVYQQDPDKGVLNAVVVGVHDTFSESSEYSGARPRGNQLLATSEAGYTTTATYDASKPAALPLVGLPPARVPEDAATAAQPDTGSGLRGVVWLDFTQGGGGQPNQVDSTEKGLPDVKVEALQDGRVVETTTTGEDGSFSFSGLDSGTYTLRLPESNFAPPFNGVSWLGPSLVTPAIIASYVWMWAGFAMVLIAAGLAAIPRDALEAARVDGGTEWQVFRRVTMPLLAPVLVVVLVTLVINVLKIFDLVYIIAPGAVQQEANVLALQMYLKSFGGGNDQGLGSAIAVFLFLLVLPAMIFNIRRFRREQR